jgi:hypothetical protein
MRKGGNGFYPHLSSSRRKYNFQSLDMQKSIFRRSLNSRRSNSQEYHQVWIIILISKHQILANKERLMDSESKVEIEKTELIMAPILV